MGVPTTVGVVGPCRTTVHVAPAASAPGSLDGGARLRRRRRAAAASAGVAAFWPAANETGKQNAAVMKAADLAGGASI
jgi:hypothetical protein